MTAPEERPWPVGRLSDSLMKYIFTEPERKELTRSLINAFFLREGEPLLTDFEFRDRELNALRRSGKRAYLDILGICQDNTLVNVEFQADRFAEMSRRSLFYWSLLYPRLLSGESYRQLKRTVCINILDFNYFSPKVAPDYHNCFCILNKHNPAHRLTDDLEIHFIEMPKWEKVRPSVSKMDDLDRWLAYLSSNTPRSELEEIAMQNPVIKEALEAERCFMDLSAYDRAMELREYRDNLAREEYLEDLRQEGRQEGREEGRREGIESMVVAMLRDGQPLPLIAKYAGASELDIAGIARRHNLG